jgi:3-mercaptopyruvate sulfurtransferase SseA
LRTFIARHAAVLLVSFMALLLAACETAPTKIVESNKRDLVQIIEKAQKPLELTPNTVVLDVRSRFDFGLNHVQNSLNFPWENLAEDGHTAEPLRDTHQAALRLSLLGLRPQTPVVILGYGIHGEGEEGRLAWQLLTLGFQDVQISAVEAFRKTMTPNETPPALNEKLWVVNAREDLQISRPDFLNLMDKRPEHTVIINVVTEVKPPAKIPAKTVDWKAFFTQQGRPNSAVDAQLAKLDISKSDRIIVLSNRGVRSAGVTYALLALGYSHAQNFTGGWRSLP